MPIYTNGGANVAALSVPDVTVNVQAPPSAPAAGLASNILGIVGTASWGPVNSAALAGLSQATAAFGPIQPRTRDLLTAVAIAALQGASIFALVRVTDGTDVAASVVIPAAALTVTAKYTGTLGNLAKVLITPGSAANSWKVTLTIPGSVPESFDNITGTGAAFWANVAAAINNGQGATRGPSNIAVATAGAGTTAPTTASYALTGGTDGASGVTATQQLGVDGATRSGMYCLRGLGCAVAFLADGGTPATWGTQLAFALSESLEMADANAPGDTPASFAAAMTTAGIDSPWFKAMVGDWCYFLDTTNNVQRLVSPVAFWAGWKVANGPAQSALNKPLLGVVGTQRSAANQNYSGADLLVIAQSRGDVITNPVPGGAYFGCRFGRNTSSDAGRHQDAYTTMTDFLATSLNAAGGPFVGRLMTPDEQREAQSSISAFLQSLQTPAAGPPQIAAYSVQVTSDNVRGIQSAKVQVQYLGVIEFFVVDLTGGQTVSIGSQVAQAA